jgi:tRNA wybutosine-synthesizing protein 3
MMINFKMQRDKAMKQLAEARKEGKADEDIAVLVDIINFHENLYTTSSCAGRICLMQTPRVHDKLESKWLGKWHGEVEFNELNDALAEHDKGVVYLQAECPILHVVTKDLDSAKDLLFKAHTCGFKRSGIHSISPGRNVLEILSTESMEAPIAEDGAIFVNDEYLEFLRQIANIKLRSGRVKIGRLENELKK